MSARLGIVNFVVVRAEAVITKVRISINYWDSHHVSSERLKSEQNSIHVRNQWKQTIETDCVTEKQQSHTNGSHEGIILIIRDKFYGIFGKRSTAWQHKHKKLRVLITETVSKNQHAHRMSTSNGQ
jgi:hypothetical protein